MDNVETSRNASVDTELIESECSTVPTDLTVSLGSESSRHLIPSAIGAYDRKKWIQEFHLIKLELSNKNILIQNLKSDFMSRVEDLEEKLADAYHQQKMMKLRMELQMNIKEEAWKRRENNLKTELDATHQKALQLEGNFNKFKEDADYLVKVLKTDGFSDKFEDLEKKTDKTSFFDRILLQLHEFANKYKIQNDELESKLEISKKHCQEYKEEFERQKEEIDKDEKEYKILEKKYQEIVEELANVKSYVEYGNYAKDNFARVKEERDKLQAEVSELNEIVNTTQAENIALMKERDSLKNDVSSLRQQQIFLQKENENIGKQLTTTTQQWGEAQDRISQLTLQLESAKQARENMFNKFITARDKFKMEYEDRLRHDMDEVRNSSNQEINKMKNNMNLFYEKEIRVIQEARDAIAKEKEVMEGVIKETKEKYEHLLQKSQNQQFEEKNMILQFNAEMQQKKYEIDKLLQIDKDKSLDLAQCKLENEKLHAKLEAINVEFQLLQQKQILLEKELTNKTIQLEQYKKFEKELNEISRKEQKGNNEVVQSMLFSGNWDMPTSALSKLQHSMSLLRKAIDLEKKVSALQQDLAIERENKEKLNEELAVANNLLKFIKKPHSLVMNAVREKEILIQQLHQKINSLEKEIETLSDDYSKLLLTHKGLAEELEKTIKNREELGKVKQLLITLHEKHSDTTKEQKKFIRILPPDHAGSQYKLGHTPNITVLHKNMKQKS